MIRRLVSLCTVLLAVSVSAEQSQKIGDLEVHYAVVNTSFLQPDVAARYGVVTGKDRAIVNLSVLGPTDQSLEATVTGSTLNLIGQTSNLEFATIRERDSIYYIAPLRFTDRDTLRFRLVVTLADRPPLQVEFQQQMFVDP